MSHINIDLQKGLSFTLKGEYKKNNKPFSRIVIQLKEHKIFMELDVLHHRN